MGAIWHLETLAHPYSKATVSLETGIRLVSRGTDNKLKRKLSVCTVSFLFSDNHLLSEVRFRSRREIFRDVAMRVRGWVGLIVRNLRFVCLFRIENPEPPK